MQIITTSEFRANQKKYFELAEKEKIFVSRRNAAPIVVYAATEEDFPSREELKRVEAYTKRIEDATAQKVQIDGKGLDIPVQPQAAGSLSGWCLSGVEMCIRDSFTGVQVRKWCRR